MRLTISQKASISPSPGTLTFMPKSPVISVSGSRITVTTVSSWSRYCCLCEMKDSFVDSSPSMTSL